MAVHEVALRLVADTARCEAALSGLRGELGDEAVEEPGPEGMLAVEVEAGDFDAAVARVRDAIAAAGADECFELGEPSGRIPPRD